MTTRIELIAQHIRVTARSVSVPGNRDLARIREQFFPNEPPIQDTEVEAALGVALMWFRNRKPVPTPQPSATPTNHQPQEFEEPSSQLVHDLDTLATMKRPELEALAKKIGLNYQPHPSNHGLTAMRARNAIANWLRQDNKLPK